MLAHAILAIFVVTVWQMIEIRLLETIAADQAHDGLRVVVIAGFHHRELLFFLFLLLFFRNICFFRKNIRVLQQLLLFITQRK